MNYKQFQQNLNKTLLGIDIKNQYQVGSFVIKETVEDNFVVNTNTFSSFKEAIEYIKSIKHFSLLENFQHNVTDHTIASLINEHHNTKVTNTLIESIRTLAETKQFTLDPVVEAIRPSILIDDKIDFILEDGSTVYVDRNTIKQLNNIFSEHLDVVDHMKQSSNNFISVVEKLQNKR